MQREVELKVGFFQQPNSLLFRGKPSHSIGTFSSAEKNIEVKAVAISKQGVFRTKKGEITQYLIADETGCCLMNFFNETGHLIQDGDLLYISGAYTSFYKESLLIYQGACGIVRRVGRWYGRFNLDNNVSLRSEGKMNG